MKQSNFKFDAPKSKILGKILILAILLLITPALARQTHFSSDDTLRIDLISYSPSPAIIGSESNLKFEVTNTGVRPIKNLEIIPSAIFPLSTQSEKIIISELKSSQSQQFTIKIKINQDAEEDTYNFFLQFQEPTLEQITILSYDVIIKRLERTIASTTATTDPEYIPPGGTGLINIEIENNADFSMRDVEVKLNFSDSVPLAPYQSTSQKQISSIKSQTSETVEFQVIALPDADPGVYRLPFSIIFNDELGNENSRQDYIGLIITKTPEYDLTIEDSTLIRGIRDEITISFSNIGPSNIKYLIMEVLPTKYYKILTAPRTYIGNLEPDDYETAEFDIYPKRFGNIPIKLKLEYKDDLNNPVTEIKEVKTYVYSKTQAKMMGLIPSKTFRNLIIILLIIFIYLTYKSWKTTRNLPNAMKTSALKMLIAAKKIAGKIRWNTLKRIPRKIKIFFIKLK